MTLGHFRRMHGRHIPVERQVEIIDLSIRAHDEKVSQLKPPSKKVKIGIVGGGFAGLYAGYLLSNLGLKVTVFEASDRVGGRVHSLKRFSKARIVEAGAEYIGLNHGAWLSLARNFGLGLIDITSDNKISGLKLQTNIVLDGEKLSGEEAALLEAGMNEVFNRIALDAKIIQYPNQPWLEPPEIQALDFVSTGQVLDKWGVTGKVRQLFDVFYENDNAGSPFASSYLGDLCAIKGGSIDGKTEEFYDIYQLFKCADGNQALAEKLAENINGKVKLCSPVTKIKYNGHSFKVVTNEKQYRFDYVILATAASVWKRIHFSPSFRQSLYKPSLGPAIKYLTTVEKRFWIKEGISPNGLNDVIGEIWEATENQSFKDKQGINLIVFAGGKFTDIALKLPKKKGAKIYNKEMDKNFEGEFLPNFEYSELSNHPQIKYIETGYSFMGLGKTTTVAKRDNFPLPEFDNKLFLAGEYTSVSFYGYMEGALQSAIHAVELLTEQLE